nr:hypothetical protein [Tanacetum cinerariifolium]
VPTKVVADEAVYEEMYDNVKRAATTATGLDAKQDRGVIRDVAAQTRLEKKRGPRTHGLKRLYKIGLSARVESSAEEDSLGEEKSSKQERNIVDIDANAKTTLVNETVEDRGRFDDQEMFDTDVLNDEEVDAASIATVVIATDTTVVFIDDITLAQALAEIKTSKPKARGIIMQEPSETPTTTTILISLKVQDKGKEEQGELTIEEKSRLFVELVDKRKKHFAKLKAEEQRRKPPTKAQKRNQIWINTFVPMDSKVVKDKAVLTQESNSKRAGDDLEQENAKKQRVKEENDSVELKRCLEIVSDDGDDGLDGYGRTRVLRFQWVVEIMPRQTSDMTRRFVYIPSLFIFYYCPYPSVSLTMSGEDQNVNVAALPKFDMPLYDSKMTAKDVKWLAIQHGIPLDLHPVALTKGWIMDQLSNDMIGLYEQYFEFSRIKLTISELYCRSLCIVPSVNLFRIFYKVSKQGHLFSFEKRVGKGAGDINDLASVDGFSVQDVQTLTEKVIDLRPIPFGLLFQGGLTTTWDFLGFRPIFKDTKGNGHALTPQEYIGQHTIRPFRGDQTILEKTDHQKRVEVEDPKIVDIREKKTRAAAKKKEKRRHGDDGRECSHPKTKKRKIVAHKDGSATSEATSSSTPLRTIIPTGTNPSSVATATAESREDRSLHTSPLDSANHSIHRYSDGHDDNEEMNSHRLGSFIDQSRGNLKFYIPKYSNPLPSIHRRCRLDTSMWCRELMVQLAPPVTQEESNALNNATALEKAWFPLARGALAQTDILERFEHLQADFYKIANTHSECADTVRKLVQARLDLAYSSHLYTNLADRYKVVKSEDEGCGGKLEVLENKNSEPSQVNKDQALRIKELEDELAKKDPALVYAEKINADRAQQKEKLVAQLNKTEIEKFDCIRKLLPTVVNHLF